jgi:hypothetical protein
MNEEHKSQELLLEDLQAADIFFRNFSGLEREFNSAGDRNFSVKLDPTLAKQLIADGWRVKQLKPREEGEEGDYHLKVNVNYKKGKPPRVVIITSNNRTDLGMDEVGLIDAADILKADVMINGWWSDMAGGGYGGYLKTMFVTLREDALELKYADIMNDGRAEPSTQEMVEEMMGS